MVIRVWDYQFTWFKGFPLLVTVRGNALVQKIYIFYCFVTCNNYLCNNRELYGDLLAVAATSTHGHFSYVVWEAVPL